MIRGLPASIILHAAVFGVGYLSWPFMTATTRDSEAIIVPIEIVDFSELNNIAPVLRKAPEPEPEIAPEEPEEVPEEEPEVEPDPVDETLPEAEVDTASQQAAEEESEPEEAVPDFEAEPEPKQPEPEPKKSEPEPKAVVKKADPLDSLLNDAESTFESERQTRRKQEPPKPIPSRLLDETPPVAQEQRRGAGERTANTARLESLLYNQILNCWDGVDDQPDAENLNVRMSIELDEEGYLKGRIRLVQPSREPLGRSPMRVAVERARRAVQKCAPYSLPAQEYAQWKDINVNLGPAFGPTSRN